MRRRDFLPASAALLLSRPAAASVSPSDKLNIAGVGIGGMGGGYLRGCESENIVALCDVDDELAAPVFERYPQAKRYRDFRVMLEKQKDIDAVIVGTPDHTHALVALAAMRLGKHVYCAKPLTRTIREARLLARTAREKKLATQMSVQSCASDPALSTVEWVQAGVVGAVREVHVWTDRPVWPQALARPAQPAAPPATLDWDLWLGPAPLRPYHPVYHPFRWRGWCDFGTGALGDMACHSFHIVFRALRLGHPASVQASSTFLMEPAYGPEGGWMRSKKVSYPETFPASSVVTWDFPARGELPPVRMTWYEGGIQPPRPPDLEPDAGFGSDGLMFVGDKGVLLSGFSGGPRLAPESRNKEYTPPPKTLPRSIGHYQEWIEAAKGGKPANCEFGFGGLLTETALLGVIAIRTNKLLLWDSETMRITNEPEANQHVEGVYRAGWCV